MATFADLRLKSDVPVLIADHRGIIAGVNDCFAAAFGWTSQELVGQMLTVIIPRTMRDAHNLGFSRFLTTGQPKLLNQPLELKMVAKDGRERAVEVVITAEQHGAQWMFAAALRPL